jgi:hypothetical protein
MLKVITFNSSSAVGAGAGVAAPIANSASATTAPTYRISETSAKRLPNRWLLVATTRVPSGFHASPRNHDRARIGLQRMK